jgi:hypothetical protein
MNANGNSPSANVRLKRIKTVSRIVRYVTLGILILSFVQFLIFAVPGWRREDFKHPVWVVWFVLVSLPQVALWVWYWKLAKMFQCYECGLIFATKTIQCMKTLGVLCVVSWMLITLRDLVSHPAENQKFAILPQETRFVIPEGTETNTIYALYLPPDSRPAPTQIIFPEVTRTNTIDLLYLRQPMVPAPIQQLKTGFFVFSIGRINFGLLLGGIIILIIAWIMDEGRKIQEEQELTV